MEDEFYDLLAGIDASPRSELDIFSDGGESQSTAHTSIAGEDLNIKAVGFRDEKGQQQERVLPATETFRITASTSTAATVREQIERIFNTIRSTLMSNDGQLSLTINVRPANSQKEAAVRRIGFPGKTAEEAWRFTVVMRIMELIHHAICSDVVLSKRDIYYRDPALFGSQAVVDRYVDNIAYTFHVPRSMLHVTAAAKGLVAGGFNICRRDGSILDASKNKDGVLIPNLKDVLSIDMSRVKWILVIEKEASFRSIAASSFWGEIATHGMIMTGKGYPDIASRALLRFMSTASPQNGFAAPPVCCMVDFDPDGLAIMSTYRNGSIAMVHENEGLRVPQLHWLGLRSGHLTAADGLHSDQGLLQLTARDRRKAASMLESNQIHSVDGRERGIRNALQTMLMLNTKAELQLLHANPRGMEGLLASALSELDWDSSNSHGPVSDASCGGR